MRLRDDTGAGRGRVLGVAGICLAALLGLGGLAMHALSEDAPIAAHPSASDMAAAVDSVDATPAAPDVLVSPTAERPEAPSPVPPSGDAVAFARAVAEAILEWDTSDGFEPGDYRGRLLVVADPTGVEAPGLASDLETYLPTAASWSRLRDHATRQWLEISHAEVPSGWASIADADDGKSIAPGTTAVTVEGFRHRAGTWEGSDVSSEHEVAFTIFVACGPTYPTCHLLRLSELDNPLR